MLKNNIYNEEVILLFLGLGNWKIIYKIIKLEFGDSCITYYEYDRALTLCSSYFGAVTMCYQALLYFVFVPFGPCASKIATE